MKFTVRYEHIRNAKKSFTETIEAENKKAASDKVYQILLDRVDRPCDYYLVYGG